MGQSKFPLKYVVGILIALFFGVALYLRIALPYDRVFVGDWIKFTGVDAYYHIRLVENLLQHFPRHITFDPYTFYPHGTTMLWPPFLDWFLAGIIWLVSLGSANQHTIDIIGVYFPAILGALAVVPVYFIGKALFNRWAGVIAAGLIALMSGEFLGRSILGFTDHHVAETLFTAVAMLFLILAIKSARQRQLNLGHLKQRDWSVIARPLVYTLLAGVFLGIYLLTWVGGLLFVFLFFAYLIVQFIIDHLRGEATDYLGIVGTLSLLICAVVSVPFLWGEIKFSPLYLPSFAIAVLTPIVLAILSKIMVKQEFKAAYYPLTIVGLGLAGLVIFYVVEPSLFQSMVGRFGIFTPAGASLKILEKQPLLFSSGKFSLSFAWGNFTTGFFLSFISLGVLIYLLIKRNEADKTLFVVWCLLVLAATLGQRRFCYYFAINVALLTSYLSWQILRFTGFREEAPQPVVKLEKVEKKKVKLKKPQKGGFRITASRINMAFGVIVVFFLVFFPNIGSAINTAKSARFAPSDAWCESLSWFRDNTPEPFGNPDFYYQLYEPPPPGESYKYPESTYGVMVWRDYGHLITRMAHRIPICNPFGQGDSEAGQFFIAQDEASADQIMNDLGGKYVVVDDSTAISKFHALVSFAGNRPEEFRDTYYQRQGGKLAPVVLFYPEYYRSLAVRLYNFNGEAVTPQSTTVISYEERIGREGKRYKEITSSKSSPTYEEAVTYISEQKSGNYEIVGSNPFISPVPLEELKHYKLIYRSNISIMQPGDGGMVPAIKIFEYGSEEESS